jgi:dihydropteroate synthase
MGQSDCFSLNLNGELISLQTPVVMGILNITTDSFYDGGKHFGDANILRQTEKILSEGALMLDVGAYSTRPNAEEVSEEEEWSRLNRALGIIKKEFPDAFISIDSFRAEIIRRAKLDYNICMANDISGGTLDEKMFETVAELQLPYVLMHIAGTPQTMQQHTNYDNMLKSILFFLAERVEKLRIMGVNDIIIDPGFGFAKNLEQNYELLASLPEFSLFNLPMLVGFSRKRMFYQLLDISPQESLNATTVGNTLALLGGANILRVHDVKEAMEAIKIVQAMKNASKTD